MRGGKAGGCGKVVGGKAAEVDQKGKEGVDGRGWLRFEGLVVVAGAFGGKFGEELAVKGGWAEGVGGGECRRECGFVLEEVHVDLGVLEIIEVAATVEGVDVCHHGCIVMDGCPVVGKEFLCPTAEHVARSIVCSDFVNCIAIADPVKIGTPDI